MNPGASQVRIDQQHTPARHRHRDGQIRRRDGLPFRRAGAGDNIDALARTAVGRKQQVGPQRPVLF